MTDITNTDLAAVEDEAAQFLCRLEDLIKQYDQITGEMAELAKQLCTWLEMRERETFAEFSRRHGPDTPRGLIADIACVLLCAREDDLQTTIQQLNNVLVKALEKRGAKA